MKLMLSKLGIQSVSVIVMALAITRPASPFIAETNSPVYSQKATQLLGIYQALPPGAKMPGIPSVLQDDPVSLDLTAAAKTRVGAQHSADPKELCQVLGPFRMMAQLDTKFEILRDAPDKLVLLFQKSSWGHVRTIGIGAKHLQDYSKVRPMWNGDSVADWDQDTLVIDSIHFTGRTWLNDDGVVNSRQLRLTERLRLLDHGRILKYQATATDPDVLLHPATYTRYFIRSTQEISEDNCFAPHISRSAATSRSSAQAQPSGDKK